MNEPRIAPARTAAVYFACFAAGWAVLALSLIAASGSEEGERWARANGATLHIVGIELALTIHAAVIALLAWKAAPWLFAHRLLAVVSSGLPLPLLLRELWFVPAFFYLIAVLHVWLACRVESLGRLQTSHR